MSQNQNELRKKLKDTITEGFTAKTIGHKTGISLDMLSGFKNEHWKTYRQHPPL